MDNTYNIDFIARCVAGHNKTAIKSITTELENVQKQVGTNKNNISKQQDTTAQGGNGYAIINGGRVYFSDTAPTGTIPTGSIWIGG